MIRGIFISACYSSVLRVNRSSSQLLFRRLVHLFKSSERAKVRPILTYSTIFTSVGIVSAATKPFPAKNNKMAIPLSDLLQNADQVFDENKFQEALDILTKHEDQSLSEIKWRQARAMYKVSKTVDKTKKEQLIRDGFALVSDAVKKDDGNFAAHKWMAILLDANAELDGIKARVAQLTTVKMHMERALELNPEDPTNWHLLGNFEFGLADMPWYQRKVVSAFFSTPPTGTYEVALQHCLTAEEKKENFYSNNLLLIAKCYQGLKNHEQAKHYLERAAKIQILNEDDRRCQEEAAELLKKY